MLSKKRLKARDVRGEGRPQASGFNRGTQYIVPSLEYPIGKANPIK
jgi:hypothetical protein